MKDITIKSDITINNAMKALSETGKKCLLVVDDNNKLLGTLTDGDLRRGILKGIDFNNSIEEIYNQDPIVLKEGMFKMEEVGAIMTAREIDLVAIIDEHWRVCSYLTWEEVFSNVKNPKKKSLTVPIVIMAGGKGARLEPFTKILPKPLIPIQEKPVIEHILERFTDVGVNEFIITVNYKSLIMKAFFEELKPDYSVDFVEEEEPLGTAGGLKFLENKFNGPFMVTNCDIIIKTDYSDLYEFHKKNGYDITLVASMKNYTIPYGTCELNDEGHLKQINEKPEYEFLVNTGLYVLNPNVLSLIPKNKLYHFTHLIKDAQKSGNRVGVYPIDDDAWIDIGQWAEYQKAVERL